MKRFRGLASLICGFLVGVLGTGTGCSPKATGKLETPGTPQTAPAALEWVLPQRGRLVKKVEQPGTVEPFEETPLFAKIPGYVTLVRADIGQRVKGPQRNEKGEILTPGELLAEVSIPEMEEEASQKEALVSQAEAEVKLAEKGVASADAQVFAMEALVLESKAGVRRASAQYERWEAEISRINNLIQRGIADAQTRDQIQGEYRSATANRDEATAKLATAEANARKARADRDKAVAAVTASQTHVKVAQAEARRLKAMLEYTKIRAPYDGIITRRKVNTGDFLTMGRADPLFTIARFEPLRLVVFVPENDAGLVQEKTPIKLRVQALKDLEVKGLITRTSWSLDPGARTLRAEIDLPNPGEKLRPGMYVHASIESPLPEEWSLPVSAVAKQGEALVCFRLVEGKLVRTPIQPGHNDGKRVEIPKWQVGGEWKAPDSQTTVAQKAAGLVDGMALSQETTSKSPKNP